MRWTIAQVAGALGTRPGAGLDPLARLAGVSIDSRAIRAGELFVAIHGPRHDGHDHVASALNLGALAAVVAEAHLARFAGSVGDRCLAVPDTFRALQQFSVAFAEYFNNAMDAPRIVHPPVAQIEPLVENRDRRAPQGDPETFARSPQRLCRQDYHEGNAGGPAGHEAAGPEIRRKFE